MHNMLRLVAGALALLLSGGCAVFQSPESWGINKSPGTDVPQLDPTELQVGTGNDKKTFSESAKDIGDFSDLFDLIADTKAAVSKQKTQVRAKLDEASGGNYGWGILGAGAALSNLHVSALKGIAFAGGTHLALSTRLSPKDQLAILNDTLTRLECVRRVANDVSAAHDATNSAKANLRMAMAVIASPSASPTALRISSDLRAAAEPDETPGLQEFVAALTGVLVNESAKIDNLFVTAAGNTNTGTDLVTSTNTLVTKLKTNDAAAKAANAEAEKTRSDLKNSGSSDQQATAVADAKKAAADAKKNEDDAQATATVRLTACQSST